MLISECEKQKVKINLETKIVTLKKTKDCYVLKTNTGDFSSPSIVIATGGLSIPKIGATDFGYKVA